jgi:hypothetical protein
MIKEERMNRRTLTAWGIAIALSAFACSNDRANNTATDRTGQPPAAGAGSAGTAGTAESTAAKSSDGNTAPVTLVGCLQKGDGRSDYILTEVNTTRTTVGTSGSTAGAGSASDVVGQEQMRAAAHAYRLSGDRDTLEPLVGKQVRVSGTLAKSSDLNAHDDSAKVKDRDRAKIDEDDLAKVEVASVDSVSDNCGGTSGRRPRSK